MEYRESLDYSVNSPREAVKVIADSMIKARPRVNVEYRPYRRSNIYSDIPVFGPRRIDLKKLYPEARPGNIVYISTVLETCTESEAKIHIIGNAKVFFKGELILDTEDAPNAERRYDREVYLNKGENPITFMVRCDSTEKFEFSFMPSVKFYGDWAKFYLLRVRATSPIDYFRHEDGVGISKLYDFEQPFDGEYVYPKPNRSENRIDFEQIFANSSGNCAYALTYAECDTVLEVKAQCKHKIFLNGKHKIFVNGTAAETLKLNKGDAVLIKVLRGGEWCFEYNDNAKIGIPILKSERAGGDKWLTLGTFSGGIEQSFGPESEIQFKKPYIDCEWKRTFWKLAGADDYVRPYLESRFFGQWFYAFMVGNYGLLKAAEALDCNEYKNYFIDSTKIMAEYFDYMRYESENFGQTTFLERGMSLFELDSIGSMGRNLCEYYKITSSPEALYCIEQLAIAARNNIPRFDDGTYHRTDDMWADDTFMSCPFLARLGRLKNDTYYYDEVIRQLMGYKKRLWMPSERIFSHIFFLDKQAPNNVPWGRGNGWIFVTLSDVLEKMPESINGREELLSIYKEFAEGIIELQDEDGLWHQVLNRSDSYSETSCTGMFILGMCRGVLNGWLPPKYKENIKKAYKGLLTQKIDASGTVYDVCRGSGNSPDAEYYMKLSKVDNDDHGTGVILAAFSEMIKL